MTMNKNDFAPTAPMGWNSYDYFNTAVTEEEVKATADYMAAHLKPHGYQYVVIDIEWYSNDAATNDHYQYIPFGDDEMDAYSRFIPSPKRFPSSAGGKGFRPLADYIHSLGLKFGIHIMRGIPRKAAQQHCPVLGTDITANEIADASSICGWNPDMYGVKDTSAGQAYYDSIISMYAQWGVDYIKCDDICFSWMYGETNPLTFSGWHETRMIHRAIMKTGRPIVLSLSPGPAHTERAWEYADNANMWRITDDFWDDWKLLKPMFWRCELWQDHVRRGCYPDCDMLPVGRIGGRFSWDVERMTRLSREEQKTMMTLWTMFGSPLMIGADLRQMDDWTLQLLTNDRLLRLLDGHHHGRQVERDEEHAIWINTYIPESAEEDHSSAEGQQGNNASGAVQADPDDLTAAFFNLSDEETYYEYKLADKLGLEPGRSYDLTDLWDSTKTAAAGGVLKIVIPAHGVRVFSLSGT